MALRTGKPLGELASAVRAFYDSPSTIDNLPLYERMLSDEPVHSPWNGFWIVTRYGDAVSILRERMGVRRLSTYEPGTPMWTLFEKFLSFLEPPDHERVRRIMARPFSPRSIEALRPLVESTTARSLAQVKETGRMDVVADLAAPLPMTVLCDWFGLPYSDREQFAVWMDDIVAGLGGTARPAAADNANDAAAAYMEYMSRQIEFRRKTPGPDLLTDLVNAREDGNRLSEHELLSLSCHMFLAGVETTMHLVGTGILHLLEHPEQLELLRSSPSLIASAVEECVRFDPPAREFINRVAVQDINLGDAIIPEGDDFTIWAGAANRDPAVFEAPNTFDIRRPLQPRHMGFGTGIHFCLGAHLARLEAQVAIGSVVREFPKLELAVPASELTYKDAAQVHGLASLPVRF